jgi:hypothetical protein
VSALVVYVFGPNCNIGSWIGDGGNSITGKMQEVEQYAEAQAKIRQFPEQWPRHNVIYKPIPTTGGPAIYFEGIERYDYRRVTNVVATHELDGLCAREANFKHICKLPNIVQDEFQKQKHGLFIFLKMVDSFFCKKVRRTKKEIM